MSSPEFNHLVRIFNFNNKTDLKLFLPEENIFNSVSIEGITRYWGEASDLTNETRKYLCYWTCKEDFNIVSIKNDNFRVELFYIDNFPLYKIATASIAEFETGGSSISYFNRHSLPLEEVNAVRNYFNFR